ncbi:MAG: LEM-3-like GIY-YIG domain-containing protein [Rhodoglobus sp.]
MHQFDARESELLGYYVYVYTDPRSEDPFYVGKGKGNRAFSHLNDGSESAKVARIREIRDAGLEPRIEVLAFGLDEKTAFKVEAAAIDLIGFDRLTNAQIGHHARRFGRKSIDSIHAELGAAPIDRFEHNVVLIKINVTFDDASRVSEMALYDATRGTWKLSATQARRAEFALAVHGGVVREVYRIADWLPAGSTKYIDSARWVAVDGRWEFVGKVADDEVRNRYRWRSVAHLYKPGAANPIMYAGPTQ